MASLSDLNGYGDPEHGLTIYLQYPMATCCICGEDDLSRWGVPIGMDGPMVGLIVANDYEGDWAAKPACRACWQKHGDGELVGHDPAF